MTDDEIKARLKVLREEEAVLREKLQENREARYAESVKNGFRLEHLVVANTAKCCCGARLAYPKDGPLMGVRRG